MSEQPRSYLVVGRSYRGSSEMLLYAADELMTANPRLGEITGGGGPFFMKAQGSEPAFVATATPFKGTASVAEIQGILRAVEERLSPPGDRDPAHPTLKLELWWVEGVHEKTPELELPSPLILEEQWAVQLFVEASENAVVNAGERGTERRRWVGTVARFYESISHHVDPRLITFGRFDQPTIKWAEDTFVYDNAAGNEADLIAQAANLSLLADVHYASYASRPDVPRTSIRRAQNDCESIVDERGVEFIAPVSVSVPAGSTLAQRCMLWVAATRKVGAELGMAGKRSVVFENGAQQIVGALLGDQNAKDVLLPASPLVDQALVETYDGTKGHSFGVKVRLKPSADLQRPRGVN